MRAYFSDARTGEILEALEYERLTSGIFKSMRTEAMNFLQDAMRSDDGKLYGAEFRWTIGDWRLEAYSFGEDWFTALVLRHFGSKRCELRSDF